MPLDSKFYVVRPTDDAFLEAIAQQDSIVLVKGARQMGKTSLLARGLAAGAQGRGARRADGLPDAGRGGTWHRWTPCC